MSHQEKKISFEQKTILIRSGKRTYIYQCNKEELQLLLQEEGLKYRKQETIDELRKRLSTYYKTKQPIEPKGKHTGTKMSLCGEMKAFDGEKWEVFEQQLECFMIVNEIEEDKKVPLLITKLTPKVFETLSYLCTPVKPMKISFVELCNKLKDKYAKPLSSVLERVEFRKRNQLPDEKVQDYMLELRKLAGKCKFKDLDDQLKEKFIEGVNSKTIQFELLKSETEITLDRCVEVARTVEAALMHTNNSSEIRPNRKSSVETEIYSYQKKTRPVYKQNKTKTEQNSGICYCCGKNNHKKSECSLNKKYCSECGQQEHI